MKNHKYTFDEFWEIISSLRGENGCPWDKIQTHESLIPCMTEEAYEVVDGIEKLRDTGCPDSLCEELGDVLMQVVFHSQLAAEEGYFSFPDVVDGVSKKMIHRHPHVFGDKSDGKPDWEALKREEKGNLSPAEEIAAIPKALPSLVRASKTQKKLDRHFGYGTDAEESLRQVQKQVAGLEHSSNTGELEDTIGEAFWHLCNFARLKGIDSEQILERTRIKQLKMHELR